MEQELVDRIVSAWESDAPMGLLILEAREFLKMNRASFGYRLHANIPLVARWEADESKMAGEQYLGILELLRGNAAIPRECQNMVTAGRLAAEPFAAIPTERLTYAHKSALGKFRNPNPEHMTLLLRVEECCGFPLSEETCDSILKDYTKASELLKGNN